MSWGFIKAAYAAARVLLADGKDVNVQVNQRGDVAIQEQFAPAFEDNANGLAWMQERAVADSLGAWTGSGSGSTKVGTAGGVIKSTAGRLRKIIAANTSGATNYYLLAFNKATAPVANDVPFACAALAQTGSFGLSTAAIDLPGGFYCSAGISYALSTTPEKLTLAGANDAVFWWFIA